MQHYGSPLRLTPIAPRIPPVPNARAGASPRLVVALSMLLALVAGCLSTRVETQRAAGTDPSGFASVAVHPVATSNDEGVQLGPERLDPEIARRMQEQAERLLETRGYRAEPVGEAELELRLQPRTEEVARRTWSSDPDASGYVVRRVREAVLELSLTPRASPRRIWQGVARSRLPDEDWIVGPSAETVWMDALLEGVKAVPERPPGAER